MARLLVTGVGGFLGSHFSRLARSQGHEVVGVSRRASTALDGIADSVITADVRTLTTEQVPAGIDAVVHFAAAQGSAEDVLGVAVNGTRNMLVCAQRSEVPHFVHLSSMSVYPRRPRAADNRPDISELEPHPERRGTYAESKTAAERTLIAWAEAAGNDRPAITVVRPGLVFGRQMPSALAGSGVAVPFGVVVALGGPRQRVPVAHINDVSTAILGLVERPPERAGLRAFDVLSGPPPTKRSFLADYGRVAGQPARPLWVPRGMAQAGARAIDIASRLRGGGRTTHYAVRRMYEFDPAQLPHDEVWRFMEDHPRENVDSCLRSALTIDRSGVDDAAAGRQERDVLDRARDMLAIGSSWERCAPGTPLILIGAGRVVSDLHVPALRHMPHHPVAAVVDPNPHAARTVAEKLGGAPALSSLSEVDPDVLARSAAVIATPGFTHAALAADALGRAGSVLIEKPAGLTFADFAAIQAAAELAGKHVSVFQNYRARPNVLRLWRYLSSHDVGALVRARLEFHSGRLETESTRWTQDEKRFRVLPMELAIHFVDLACLVGGPVEQFAHVEVTDDRYTGATAALSALGRSASGAVMEFAMSLTGSARRVLLDFEFERVGLQLSFYPEGFRVLPSRRTPLDDAAAASDEFVRFLAQTVRRRASRSGDRGGPHGQVYASHFRALEAGADEHPFGLNTVRRTMATLDALCRDAYPDG